MDTLYTEHPNSYQVDQLLIPDKSDIIDKAIFDPNILPPIQDDILANVSKIAMHQIDRDLLEGNSYSYRKFIETIVPTHHYQWVHYNDTTFDLGYYGRHEKMHDIIVGCRNILGLLRKNNKIFLELWVPIKDILDIEDPAIIEYARLHNPYIDNNPELSKGFKFQVQKEFDSFNFGNSSGLYWTEFTMQLDRSTFMW